MKIGPRLTAFRTAHWQATAACRTEDPELFHAGERNPGAVAQARTICEQCPVRAACLTAAYQEDDEWAIRGGLTNRQRRAHLRKAEGDVARAVAEATGDVTGLLRRVYTHHAAAEDDGHVVWTDTRHFINIRNKPYTVHQLAFHAIHGRPAVGHVQRMCAREGCVGEACLADRPMRERMGVVAA